MSTTRLGQRLRSSRASIYRSLTDPEAVAAWMFPDGMSIQVHHFQPRVGGTFRISLTYSGEFGIGKTSDRTDTYHGRFVDLVPDERVVEVLEFETSDPALQGEMTITFTLADAEGGTELLAGHENVPPGISPADNETGWSISLARLQALIERART